MKRVAIVQSCYVPWKGFFDLINSVDEFILYDECQYTRQDWRNRNRVKTASGSRWLTIPVTIEGLYHQRIDETRVADRSWARSHWDIVRQAYRNAPHFSFYAPAIEDAYGAVAAELFLSNVNRMLLGRFCELLEIDTALTWSTEYPASGSRTERVVSLCEAAEASVYVSGPRGRNYLDDRCFVDAGIALEYFDYDGYPEYPQLYPPFEHNVSMLDLLFMAGPEAPQYMKSFRTRIDA